MNAGEIIVELENRGARIAVVGSTVRVEAPVGAVDAALDHALRAKKPEVLELVRRRSASPSIKPTTETAALPALEGVDPVLEAKLADFKRYGGGIRLFSRVLDIEVWVASDEAAARWLEDDKDGRPVFTFQEIDVLEGILAEDLKTLARVKQAIPGCRIRSLETTS